jgi:hypothetical protein
MPASPSATINTFESGVDGDTVTIENSGGLSGDRFNVVNSGSGSTLAYDAAHAAHGTKSLKVATGPTAFSPFLAWNESTLGSFGTHYGRLHLYVTALPAANHRIFTAIGSGSRRAGLLYTTTGKIRSVDAAGATIQNTAASVPLNTWVRIEWMIVGDPAAGQVEGKLFIAMDSDTPAEIITSAATFNTGGAVDSYRFGLGASQANVAAFWLDEISIDPDGYPGPFYPFNQILVDTLYLSDTGTPDPGACDPITAPAGIAPVLDGKSQYIDLGDNEAYSPATAGGITVMALMRPDSLTMAKQESTGYVNWLGKAENDQQEWTFRMYQLGNTEGRANRISFYHFNLAGGFGNGSHFEDKLTPGTWILMGGSSDAKEICIYRDGVRRDTDLLDQSSTGGPVIVPTHGSAPVRIGTMDFKSFFRGVISHVAIWSRRLSDAEHASLQTGRASGSLSEQVMNIPGLVGFWKLDEAEGDAAIDSSATGQNGIYVGEPERPHPGFLSGTLT